MEETNFYEDIKESVNTIFAFLQSDFGFSNFQENQLAYEMHFEAKNDCVSIDIWFEAIVTTPIWIKINNYYVTGLEPENEIVQYYYLQIDELYEPAPEQAENKCYQFEFSQYYKHGKTLNTLYLNEIANILRRHSSVFKGDFELLEANSLILAADYKKKIDQERIDKGIYTLEFQLLCDDDYDMYAEFERVEEIEAYLKKNLILRYIVC